MYEQGVDRQQPPPVRPEGFRRSLTDRIGPPSVSPDDRVLFWREKMLFAILAIGLAMAALVLIPTLYMAVKRGIWTLVCFDLFAFGLSVCLLFLRKIRYGIRATFIVMLVYAVGLVVILHLGFFSGGPFWLFAFAVITAALLGLRAAVGAIVLNALTLATVGWLVGTGRIGSEAVFFAGTDRAVITALVFLMLNTAASVLVAVLLRGLADLNEKADLAIAELKHDRAQLLEAKAVRDEEIRVRKQTAASLKESVDRFRETVELMPEIIFEMDETGRLTFVNQNAFKMFGYTARDLQKGVYALDMLIPQDRKRAWENMPRDGRGGSGGLNEYTALRKDGTTFPVTVHSAPILKAGKHVGLRGFIVDLTEKKTIENQLRQSQKMEAIGTLAGGIAHDFNNILSAILGYTELSIGETRNGTLLKGNLLKIQKAGERARDLVGQILTFSRQSDQELITTQLKPIVRETLNLMRASLPADIEIRSNLQTDAAVSCDPTQIHQVLMNLCTNAGHAMSETGGTLYVDLTEEQIDDRFAARHPETTPGRFMSLSVRDTGHGMAPEVVERIFDPFFTTKKRGKGTGMGLSVVHGIVRSHGGNITVKSEPGLGSALTVYLPVIDHHPTRNGRLNQALPGGSEHILVVDDEPFQVDIGRQMLEKLGYSVTTRTNSVEALVDFREHPDRFDLVISDMTMPNMSGDQLAEKLMAVRPELPVILCTGYSEKINEEKARAMGVRKLIMKPVNIGTLSEILRNVLDGKA